MTKSERDRAILEARSLEQQLGNRLNKLEQQARESGDLGEVASRELLEISDAVRKVLASAGGQQRGEPAIASEIEYREAVRQRLIDVAARVEIEELFEACSSEASDFALKNHFAFLLACCLDRGSPSRTIWSIPYWLQQDLQHLDPAKLALMTESQIRVLLDRLPRKPKYIHQAPATIRALSRLVAHELEGEASGLWIGCTASKVKERLRAIPGVGPGLADLTVLLINKAYGYTFPDPENIDIKADVHTMRVLKRLGLSDGTPEATVEAARCLMPTSPGKLDLALWTTGRSWCHPKRPDCRQCPMDELCPKVGVRRH